MGVSWIFCLTFFSHQETKTFLVFALPKLIITRPITTFLNSKWEAQSRIVIGQRNHKEFSWLYCSLSCRLSLFLLYIVSSLHQGTFISFMYAFLETMANTIDKLVFDNFFRKYLVLKFNPLVLLAQLDNIFPYRSSCTGCIQARIGPF